METYYYFYMRYHLRSVKCKANMLISLLESLHGVQFENVYVYPKSLQQILVLGEFTCADRRNWLLGDGSVSDVKYIYRTTCVD